MEVLRHSESGYIPWTPEDYRTIFSTVPSVSVKEHPGPRKTVVPIHTTILERHPEQPLPADLASHLMVCLLGEVAWPVVRPDDEPQHDVVAVHRV